MQQAAVLATDMDGTFIPLDGNQENRRDLARLNEELQRNHVELVYVTGRHYELVLDAIESHALPSPQWMICDVGTSIYHRQPSGIHHPLAAYATHLAELVGPFGVAALAELMLSVVGLQRQEAEKQGPFKLSYYCDAASIADITERLTSLLHDSSAPYRIIASVDPFNGSGLIDFLPQGVSKAHALDWWVSHLGYRPENIIFAGDSGNDLAALTAGYRSIVVANADRAVADEAARIHHARGWKDRLYLATKPATSGVRDGLRHFIAKG
jgi:HAD superfamily hydrolase (TIGR01484 family)